MRMLGEEWDAKFRYVRKEGDSPNHSYILYTSITVEIGGFFWLFA